MKGQPLFEASDRAALSRRPTGSLASRLFSRRVGAMLVRNTIVSTGVFLIGLALLWVLVSLYYVDRVLASGISFLFANSLHYAFGRSWIFRGTERGLRAGYAYFLANSAVGLVVTMALFAAILHYTPLNYLVARVVVSIFAGLAVFVLNATLNFRRV